MFQVANHNSYQTKYMKKDQIKEYNKKGTKKVSREKQDYAIVNAFTTM